MIPKRLENLLSFACKGVLILMPVLFAVAHVAADGAVWDFATGETFDPRFNVVSSYAWRSPAGWAIVACMVGVAFVLGFVSWRAARRGPGFVAWFTAVVAAIAMAKMLEVAWYPFKPSQETFARIQDEIGKEPTAQIMKDAWRFGLYAIDVPGSERVYAPEYLKSLRSHWIHDQGVIWAQKLILLTMMGAALLWRRPDRGPDFWLLANLLAMISVGAGVLGRYLLPEYSGINQRVIYLGFYIWMLIVVREIERQRRLRAEAAICGPTKSNQLAEDADYGFMFWDGLDLKCFGEVVR